MSIPHIHRVFLFQVYSIQLYSSPQSKGKPSKKAENVGTKKNWRLSFSLYFYTRARKQVFQRGARPVFPFLIKCWEGNGLLDASLGAFRQYEMDRWMNGWMRGWMERTELTFMSSRLKT